MTHSIVASRVLVTVSAVIYLFSLWSTLPELGEKGYFLAVLLMGGFSVQVYHSQDTGSRLAAFSRFIVLLSMGLLTVGLWNTPLPLAVKGIALVSWCAFIYGVATSPVPAEPQSD